MLHLVLLGLFALFAVASAANFRRVTCPDGVHTATNAACCVFFSLADELQNNVFNHTCFEHVHHALRLAFQDAIGFSFSLGPNAGGGADGSIMIFDTDELKDPANIGMDVALDDFRFLLQDFDVTAGDLIQFAAAVGITNCPGAPQLQFLAGRPNATAAAQPGLVPLPESDLDTILARMADAGYSPTELVSLLAAHSIAHTDLLVNAEDHVPFDTTPFTFDSQFFLEVLLKGNETLPPASGEADAQVPNALAAQGEFRMQSDFVVSKGVETACFWQDLVTNQEEMQEGFKDAMFKLSITGQNQATLIDCTEAVPSPVPVVLKPVSFPAGTGPKLLELACDQPLPSIPVDPGEPTTIPACPDGDTNAEDCQDIG